ncbi:MAG: MobF family relaxase [Synechococcus sp.]
MLTAKNVTPGMGAHYYKKENYYSSEQSQEQSRWFGKGAKQLGLRGKIQPEVFEQLLNGVLPSGDRFRTRRRSQQPSVPGKKQPQVRAGLDLTFSAPKSVSLLALAYGDGELEKAHRIAVERTLKVVEQRYAQTRVRFGSAEKDRRVVTTGNLVVGHFHHDTSRELDPHLHTHCVLLNMTRLENGRWYSLHNDRIYKHRKLLGQIYQNELARQVQQLGYRIEPRDHGQFEIAGFSREQLEFFSERRRQILQHIGAESTWAERESVWDATRTKKGEPVARQELQNFWFREAQSIRIEFPQRERRSQLEDDSEEQLKQAIADGIEHCSEREVAFPTESIEQFVLSEVGKFGLGQVQTAIAESEELIYLDDKVTTEKAVQRELSTIRLMHRGQGQVEAIAEPEAIARYLDGREAPRPNDKRLTAGQREGIELAATTSDRVVAWQGVAGAGKTFALKEFKVIAEGQGYVLRGFAPSAEAAKVLGEEVGISSATVASLLFSPLSNRQNSHEIWVVDEAGLLSANDALALLARAQREGARTILVGDTRQLSAVEAGNPFKSLQQAGMRMAYLDESRRQRTPELRQGVRLISRGRVREGIEQFQQTGCIAAIADESQRQARLVEDYLALSPEERDRTLVLAGTNRERLGITQRIRAGLREEGQLGEGVQIERLEARDLTEVQMRYVHHFAEGDVVMPLYRNVRQGLEKGAFFEVVGKEGDRLVLRAEDGSQRIVDVQFKKVVFARRAIEIAPGDVLRWTKNNRELERRNGQQFWVESIEGNEARVQYADGRFEAIDLSRPQHLDYALVSTTYAAQGKTAERALIAADRTIGKESFYVAVSRVKTDLKLYTENIEGLTKLAQRSRANQNPIELLRQQLRERLAQESAVGGETSENASSEVGDRSEQQPITRNVERPSKPAKPKWWPRVVSNEGEGDRQPEIDRNPGLEPKHYDELHRTSAIAAELIALNFLSLRGEETYRRVCYSDRLSRRKDGELSDRVRRRYSHLEKGGWWCSGLDPLDYWKPMQWGCFKPDYPRISKDKGKPIKYEHPIKTSTRAFFLDVPDLIWEKVARSYGLEMPGYRGEGFWAWVQREQVPIVLVEGAKKAACLLSAGYAAIALPGIWNGRRKAAGGKPERVIPELLVFVREGREVFFCFDRDEKPRTRKNVQDAIWKTGRLLQRQGCEVGVIELPGPEKGVDDFVVGQGAGAFEAVYAEGQSFREWDGKRRRDRPELLVEIETGDRKKVAMFEPPDRKEKYWPLVREYLVTERSLPEEMIDSLHDAGQLYAAGLKEGQEFGVVFLERDFSGNITGAFQSKLLPGRRSQRCDPGDKKNEGWFYFSMGEGQKLKRVVLAESPIDALSAAVLTQRDVKTMFVAVDDLERIPARLIEGAITRGGEIYVASNANVQGESMAAIVKEVFPQAIQIRPPLAREWNDCLRSLERNNMHKSMAF